LRLGGFLRLVSDLVFRILDVFRIFEEVFGIRTLFIDRRSVFVASWRDIVRELCIIGQKNDL
jgi:hypothetical protein